MQMSKINIETKCEEPQEKIFSMLFDEDEITWQSMIYDLVKTEGMDPWDVDVSLLSVKFLDMLKKLKEMDFRISGKIVLASAILLKIKSNKLLTEDINALDSLIAGNQEEMDLLDELGMDEEGTRTRRGKFDGPKLMPKTPQPRKRKVSIYDLVKALEKALEVNYRRPPVIRNKTKARAPQKGIDISSIIKDVYDKVNDHYKGKVSKEKTLSFSQLIPSESKEDKVFTFIPLLHLENQERVELEQEDHFKEIMISLIKTGPLELMPEELQGEQRSIKDF